MGSSYEAIGPAENIMVPDEKKVGINGRNFVGVIFHIWIYLKKHLLSECNEYWSSLQISPSLINLSTSQMVFVF